MMIMAIILMMVLVMMKDGVDNALMMMTMRLGARELGVSDDLIACCFEFEDYCESLKNRFNDNDDGNDDGDDDDDDAAMMVISTDLQLGHF